MTEVQIIVAKFILKLTSQNLFIEADDILAFRFNGHELETHSDLGIILYNPTSDKLSFIDEEKGYVMNDKVLLASGQTLATWADMLLKERQESYNS
tara:strand:+ start:913 stop:1200 length:288 start_codon:yes stop_codon:yes gene_type:complete